VLYHRCKTAVQSNQSRVKLFIDTNLDGHALNAGRQHGITGNQLIVWKDLHITESQNIYRCRTIWFIQLYWQ